MASKKLVSPKHIMFNGVQYTLVKPLILHADGISEGPFYSRKGVDPEDWAYLPDAAYLLGIVVAPNFMHCIQQSHFPRTPRPVN